MLFCLLLPRGLDDFVLCLAFFQHFEMLDGFEPISLLGRRRTPGNCDILELLKRVIDDEGMQDSYVHLGPVVVIDVGVVDFLEYFKAFLDFAKDGVFSCKGGKVGLGKSDKEIAIVKVGS